MDTEEYWNRRQQDHSDWIKRSNEDYFARTRGEGQKIAITPREFIESKFTPRALVAIDTIIRESCAGIPYWEKSCYDPKTYSEILSGWIALTEDLKIEKSLDG